MRSGRSREPLPECLGGGITREIERLARMQALIVEIAPPACSSTSTATRHRCTRPCGRKICWTRATWTVAQSGDVYFGRSINLLPRTGRNGGSLAEYGGFPLADGSLHQISNPLYCPSWPRDVTPRRRIGHDHHHRDDLPSSPSRYREIEVWGPPRELGRRIGEAAREEIRGFSDIALGRVNKTVAVSRDAALPSDLPGAACVARQPGALPPTYPGHCWRPHRRCPGQH